MPAVRRVARADTAAVPSLLLTVDEAAEALRVSRATIYRSHLNKPRGLKGVMVGGRRMVRRTDLDTYIKRLAA